MIWTTGGVPMQGLTGGGGGDRRVEYILPKEWRNEPDAPHVPPSFPPFTASDRRHSTSKPQ